MNKALTSFSPSPTYFEVKVEAEIRHEAAQQLGDEDYEDAAASIESEGDGQQ